MSESGMACGLQFMVLISRLQRPKSTSGCFLFPDPYSYLWNNNYWTLHILTLLEEQLKGLFSLNDMVLFVCFMVFFSFLFGWLGCVCACVCV